MQQTVSSQWRFLIIFESQETSGASAAKGPPPPQISVVFAVCNNFYTDAGLRYTEMTAKIWT